MFRWLRNLVSRRRTAPRRDIFVFRDGTQDRRLDPWNAWIKLWTDPDCDFKTQMPLCAQGDPEASRAIEALTRRVFGVQEFDPATGSGMTLLELHDLLGRFSIYIRDLKKKLGILPTPSRPTGSGSSETPPDSTTRPASDSSSTASEPTCAAST